MATAGLQGIVATHGYTGANGYYASVPIECSALAEGL